MAGYAPPARFQAFRSLRHRDFRLLLFASTLQSASMPLQFLTLIFWVQDEQPGRSVLFVSLISASRGSALLLFGLLGGAVADRLQRRKVLLACETAACCLTALTAFFMLARPFGEATIVAVLACTMLSSTNLAIDMPARTASIPTITGMGDLSNAIGLNMVAAQVVFPAVLLTAGALNSWFEPGQVYAGSLVLWLGILPLIGLLHYESKGEAREGNFLMNVRDGLSYTGRHPVLLGAIGVTAVLHAVGMPGVGALGPVWMTEVLGLSRGEFGLMAMTWGLGALTVSLALARWDGLPRRGITLCAFVVLFAAAAIVFGHSRIVALTAVMNFTIGGALIGTMMTATTITQHVSDEGMRGRVMGLFPLIMGISMLNALPAGALAQATSIELMMPLLGWATLALAIVVAAASPDLRRITVHARQREATPPARIGVEGPAIAVAPD